MTTTLRTTTARTTGRIVGALFLLAYVVYLAGGALAGSGSASTVVLSHVAGHQLQISAGALLMLANSAAVIGIGVLIFPVLGRHHKNSAYGYLAAQVAQGLMLAVGIVFLLLRIPLAQQYAERGDFAPSHDGEGVPPSAHQSPVTNGEPTIPTPDRRCRQ